MLTATMQNLARSAAFILIPLLLTVTWGFSSGSKLQSRGVPQWFTSAFENSFIDKFPGLWLSFYSITFLELAAAITAASSLLSFEYQLRRPPVLLVTSILLSLLIFIQLSIGKYLIADHEGTHQLYTYFAGTLIFLAYVTHHTPATQTLK